MKKFLFISLVLWFPFWPSLAAAEDIPPSPDEETPVPFGSLEKSLLVPGWGQMAEKRCLEGALFLTAETACLVGFLWNNHKGNDYYSLYEKADNPADAVLYRSSTEIHDIRRNRFLLAAAAVWAINLIDIYVIVKGRKNKETKEKELRFHLESYSDKGLALVLSLRY